MTGFSGFGLTRPPISAYPGAVAEYWLLNKLDRKFVMGVGGGVVRQPARAGKQKYKLFSGELR